MIDETTEAKLNAISYGHFSPEEIEKAEQDATASLAKNTAEAAISIAEKLHIMDVFIAKLKELSEKHSAEIENIFDFIDAKPWEKSKNTSAKTAKKTVRKPRSSQKRS